MKGIVAIIRAREVVDLNATCRALAAGGLGAMEITLNTPGALAAIRALRSELPAVTIGAGTILRPDDARAAIDHGAQFIVTPTLQPATIALCRDASVPICCGAFTPTEIYTAHDAGTDYVKLFPASAVGLDYIKAVLAPMPFISFIPTGGVNLQNLQSFLQFCPAVGVGGNLVDPELLKNEQWEKVTQIARQYAVMADEA